MTDTAWYACSGDPCICRKPGAATVDFTAAESDTLLRFALAEPAPESWAVRGFAREFAGDEMRAVAHRLDDGGDEAIEVALGGAHYVHRVLCDTAHALDGKP